MVKRNNAARKNSRRKSTRPRKRTARTRKKRKANTGRSYGKVISFIGLVIIITLLLHAVDNLVFNTVFRTVSGRPTQGDFAGNLIYDAINLHHSIWENPNNKARLLQNLTNPFKWYSSRQQSHEELKFGSSYDRFAFTDDLEFDHRDFRENNYEVRFNGMYRYRYPKNALVAFESGLVIIEEGKIKELRQYQNPNGYRCEWINHLYKQYWIWALSASFLLSLVMVNISQIPDNIRQWIWRGLQKTFGF